MFEEIFRESTATLLAEIANLKSTIGRFSEFSKMPQPKFQQVEVNDVVQQVIRVFQAQLKPAGKIDWRMILEDDLPTIAADAELLHRVISNLVLNAMDAMPDGGMLTVRTYKEDDGVRVEVSDTGSGLTPEECERLFTPYYTTKQHGTGLGLAIVQSIVTDHQGRVSVQSTPGRGTSFTVDLPRNWDKLAVAERELAKAGVPDGRGRPSPHNT
jgi:two-component system NtrC family sensor kinase